MNLKELSELAYGLQHSNHKEVSALARAYLALEVSYQELRTKYVKNTAEEVMRKHEKLLKRLAINDKGEEE